MNSLRSVSSDVRGVAEFVHGQVHPPGLKPLLCFGDSACLYHGDSGDSSFATCDQNGNCKTVQACEEGHAFSETAGGCVKVGEQCGAIVNHEVYKYDSSGTCSPSGTCERSWSWNPTSARCEYDLKDSTCEAGQDPVRVARFDVNAICVVRDECVVPHVFSSANDKCVEPQTVCSDTVDRRVMKFNNFGECVAANECESKWELVDDKCVWGKRDQKCDPSAAELAKDDKRGFEYDAAGACIATNRCLDKWSLGDDGICKYNDAGKVARQANGRRFIFDLKGLQIPGECVDGYELVQGNCLYKNRGNECLRSNNIISKYDGAGTCVTTSQCVSDQYVFSNGACTEKPKGCPSGFSESGGECYRSFHMGGEGSRTVSFSADPAYQIRARYDFRKEPRYKDGDYSISSNFGLGGGQGGIRGSHSMSSGWTAGKSSYTFHARQNDGHGTLHVWLKNP